MRIIHFLADGSRLEDITGHVVKFEDAAPLYEMIETINLKMETLHNQEV